MRLTVSHMHTLTHTCTLSVSLLTHMHTHTHTHRHTCTLSLTHAHTHTTKVTSWWRPLQQFPRVAQSIAHQSGTLWDLVTGAHAPCGISVVATHAGTSEWDPGCAQTHKILWRWVLSWRRRICYAVNCISKTTKGTAFIQMQNSASCIQNLKQNSFWLYT